MEKKTSIATAQIDYHLLAHLSHDVRSPFNGLIGFSDLLSSHFDELSDDKRKEYADLVYQLSRKSFFQLQFFTTWIKLISNNLHVNLAVVDCKEIIHQCIDACSNDIEAKNVSIEKKGPLSFRIQADVALTTIAIASILSSAIRVVQPDTSITVTTVSEKPLHLTVSGKYADHIDPETDPFEFAILTENGYTESSSKLWVAKQIIDKHHGSLSIVPNQDPSVFDIHITYPDPNNGAVL